MEYRNILEELGFTAKETSIYLAVLRLGKSAPAKIAKVTKLNRPTVYSVIKGLISKGLLAEDLTDNSLQVVPLPLENLKVPFEKAKAEIHKKEKLADQAIAELKAITSGKHYSVPRIRFIEQGEINDFLYHNVDKWQKSISDPDGAMYGFQDHSFAENFQPWIEWAADKYRNSNFKVRLFSNESEIERRLKGTMRIRNIRFLEDSHFTSSTWSIGEYLVMIYTRTAPFYLVEIHDAAMAQNLNDVFKTMWLEKSSRT